MSNYLKSGMTGLVAVLLLLGACATESGRKEPVKTTTSTSATDKTAPAAKEAKDRGQALVRVIHALPGERNIDVLADNNKVFTDVAYKAVTPYQEISSARHNFLVRPTGEEKTAPLAQNSESLGAGKHYTVVAFFGSFSAPQTLSIVDDNLTPPSAGKAKVRVINASPDEGKVDLYVQGKNKALFDGVNYQSATGYTEIDPMSGALEVRPAGQDKPILGVPSVKFEAGKIYTVVITGRAKMDPSLEVVTVEDQLGG